MKCSWQINIKVLDRNRYIGNTNFFAKLSTLISTFKAENEKNLSTYEAENGEKFKHAEAHLKKGCAYKRK